MTRLVISSRRMKLRLVFFSALVFSLVIQQATKAQDAIQRDLSDRFTFGSWEFENMVGTYYLFDRGGKTRPNVDNVIDSARFGVMLYNPNGPGILRGNVEFLGEAFGGVIFHGPGDALFGVSIFLRYNFIQPSARIVPYFQAGGGGVHTDIEHGAASGNAISQDFNFNVQVIGGARFLINSKWSINLEAGYRHISNAGLSDPNYGIDQIGGALGFGLSF